MTVSELLRASEQDPREALRLLFVLARRSAECPDAADSLTGRQLAMLLWGLLDEEEAAAPGQTRRLPRRPLADEALTAATVVEAVDELLRGEELELAPADERYGTPRPLGAGGMGMVFGVYDRRLHRAVARKVLHGGLSGLASARRFAREAELTAQLEHPNIVPLYDFDRDADGALYFTMKEVRGRSLAELLDDHTHEREQGAIHETESRLRLVQILRSVCDGVAYAHGQGVVHRDLKPDNIMVGDFGEVLVMDWGLARRTGAELGDASGTAGYVAPECRDGSATEVRPEQDVYALGRTLDRVLRLDSAPQPELLAVVARASAPVSERYPTVKALAADIQAWLDGRPLQTFHYSSGALLTKWVRRNRRASLGVAATTALALLLGAVGLVRYISDVTQARDVAELERDRAREAETERRLQLARALQATARAHTETGRFLQARALYDEALGELMDLAAPVVGVELGHWDNHQRATTPLFTIPLPAADRELVVEDEQGWLIELVDGQPVVARQPPLFDEVWRSRLDKPPCEAQGVRWEQDRLALYCVEDSGLLRRWDLLTGTSEPLGTAGPRPWTVTVPGTTSRVFLGSGYVSHDEREPVRSWEVLEPVEAGWASRLRVSADDVVSAVGPRFIAERYGAVMGTTLFDLEHDTRRVLANPRARGVLDPTGSSVAYYSEQSYRLVREDLAGTRAWERAPDRALVVWDFAEDLQTLLAAGTRATVLELDARTGERVGSYEGHTRPLVGAWHLGGSSWRPATNTPCVGSRHARPRRCWSWTHEGSSRAATCLSRREDPARCSSSTATPARRCVRSTSPDCEAGARSTADRTPPSSTARTG